MPFAPSNGVELYYETLGSGPPLLLIMGIGSPSLYWPPGMLEHLAKRFRVIVFDNRDIGRSTILKGVRFPSPAKLMAKRLAGLSVEAPYTLSDMADDCIGLLDHLNVDRAHVAGMSMGGMIAQELALGHPERVASLTSVSSTTGSRRFVGTPSAMRALLGPVPRSREEAGLRGLEACRVIGSGALAESDAVLRSRFEEAYDQSPSRSGFGRQFAAMLASGSRSHRLAELRLPTLVVHGDLDPLIPSSAGRATAELIPGAVLQVVSGMGHDLPPMLWEPLAGWLGTLVFPPETEMPSGT